MPQSDQPDDLGVPDNGRLLRLINPNWFQPDGQGGLRVTSQAFQNHPTSNATSFVLYEHLVESGREAEDLISDKPGYGVVELLVSDVRRLEQQVVRDPTDNEPGHVLVVGEKNRRVRKKMAQAARWVVLPVSPLE